MDTNQLTLLGLIVGAAGALGFVATQRMAPKVSNRLLDRLRTERVATTPDADAATVAPRKSLLQRFGQMAASPFMPKSREKQGGMRKQLAKAGIYEAAAVKSLTGFKLIMLIGGLILGFAVGTWIDKLFLVTAVLGLIGYMAPIMWLRMRIAANQKELQQGLPDSLDLMVVCVEAGLTVDAAMSRVGQELALAHPAISREFGIAHMETCIGLSRAEALKNMGIRTANPAIQQLAAMLVQAERFGTSVAQALRIQSETLRVKRQHVAEELAAKASVKMSFPLVLFIFPSTFIVLAGPTVIGLMNSAVMQ